MGLVSELLPLLTSEEVKITDFEQKYVIFDLSSVDNRLSDLRDEN